MQCYRFELHKESQDLCTIIMPFGKYKYTWDSWWDSNALQTLLKHSWKMHCQTSKILTLHWPCWCFLQWLGSPWQSLSHNFTLISKNGFTINPLKCEWAVKETDWLGYWLTPWGLKPWKKKIDAILHMDHPCNAMELHMFIGCVNYYCDMWPSCAHILKCWQIDPVWKRKLLWNGQMKCKRRLSKCICLWLPMLLQLTTTNRSGLTYTLMPLTSG